MVARNKHHAAMKERDCAYCPPSGGAGGDAYLGGERCGGKALVAGSENKVAGRRQPFSVDEAGTPVI